MSVQRVPEGYEHIMPHLTVKNAERMIDFYKRAFGAVEHRRSLGPDGKTILHGEIQIGRSRIFLNDEYPDMGAVSPLHLKGTPITIHMFVEDVDAIFQRAVAAGAEVVMPLADQFWGDRYGILKDPSGHQWSLASHLEDLTPAQIKERMEAAFSS